MGVKDYEDDFQSDGYEDYNDDVDSTSFDNDVRPQSMDFDMFSLRTNPEPILEKFELHLLNKAVVIEDGKEVIIQRNKTVPLCNEQGIQEIMFHLRSVINNHVIQGNFPDMNTLRLFMREISDDLTIFMWSKSTDWNLKDDHVNPIINSASNMIFGLLTRTLFNKERELYGEQFKETTSREFKAQAKKRNPIMKSLMKPFSR